MSLFQINSKFPLFTGMEDLEETDLDEEMEECEKCGAFSIHWRVGIDEKLDSHFSCAK